VNVRGDAWRAKRGCDKPADTPCHILPDGTKIFRCPNTIHSSYWQALIAWQDYKALTLRPFGVSDINKAPNWIVQCFRTFELHRAEAKMFHMQKMEQDMKTKSRKAQAGRR